jgi:hypothetical protein
MHPRLAVAILSTAAVLAASPLAAQNQIAQGGWEGFVTRSPEGRFDRCVLYNRTVSAINIAPYGMFGLSRDANAGVGLLVFYQPRTLERGTRPTVELRIDERPPITLTGDVLSDFHVVVSGPLDTETLSALGGAHVLEVTTDSKPIRFPLTGVDAVLDRLKTCVDQNAH